MCVLNVRHALSSKTYVCPGFKAYIKMHVGTLYVCLDVLPGRILHTLYECEMQYSC